jgi:hypothetical protein
MTAAAIDGSFAEYRMVKTRGVLVLCIEIPLERSEQVFKALGYPLPGKEIHVGIARLQNPEDREPPERPSASTPAECPPPPSLTGAASAGDASKAASPKIKDLARSELMRGLYASLSPEDRAVADAGKLAKNLAFQAWSLCLSEERAAEFIRSECGVPSRGELATNPAARRKFDILVHKFMAASGRLPEAR